MRKRQLIKMAHKAGDYMLTTDNMIFFNVTAFISLFMFAFFVYTYFFAMPQAYENKTYHFDTGRVVEYKLNSLSHHEYVYKVYKYVPNTGFTKKKFQYKYISKDRVIPNKDVIK